MPIEHVTCDSKVMGLMATAKSHHVCQRHVGAWSTVDQPSLLKLSISEEYAGSTVVPMTIANACSNSMQRWLAPSPCALKVHT